MVNKYLNITNGVVKQNTAIQKSERLETNNLVSVNSVDMIDSSLLYPKLIPVYLTNYTVDTWTTVYENTSTNFNMAYFLSITNRSETDAIINLRLVDELDNEIHTFLYNITLTGFEGLENEQASYPIPIGYKIQFKSSALLCECLLTIGAIDNCEMVYLKNTNSWYTLYENITEVDKRIILFSIININASEISTNVTLKITDNTNADLYHITPPLTLPANIGVENKVSLYIIQPTQKLVYYATENTTQVLAVLVDN